MMCASASVSRLTRPLQPRNRDETFLPSRTRKRKHIRRYEPGTRTGYTTNTVVMDTWILRLWGSGGACNLRGQPRYVSSFYYQFRVIHSFISARMAFSSFLAHTPTSSPCCSPSQSNLRPNSFDVAAFIDLQGLELLK